MPEAPADKTPAQKLEATAFTFCKCATLALLLGRYTLPVAALAAAGFFIASAIKGQKDTRCFAGKPLVIAVLWIIGAAAWIWFQLIPVGIESRIMLFPWTAERPVDLPD